VEIRNEIEIVPAAAEVEGNCTLPLDLKAIATTPVKFKQVKSISPVIAQCPEMSRVVPSCHLLCAINISYLHLGAEGKAPARHSGQESCGDFPRFLNASAEGFGPTDRRV